MINKKTAGEIVSLANFKIETNGDTTPWNAEFRVAKLAYDGGYYMAAKKHFRKALSIAETTTVDDKEISATLIGLGLSYCHLKEYTQAEQLFKRVLQCAGNESDDSSMADALTEIAVLYQKQGNLIESQDLLEHCLRSLQDRHGDKIGQARVMKSLALVYCKTGSIDAAENLINKAYNLSDTQQVRLTGFFAEILGVMSLVAVKKKKYEEAEELVGRSISILELATGGEHPEVADFLEYAAEIFKDAGCGEKANSLLKRAESLRLRVKARDR
jgi:tetratricopeptide (TPR) repeat protein